MENQTPLPFSPGKCLGAWKEFLRQLPPPPLSPCAFRADADRNPTKITMSKIVLLHASDQELLNMAALPFSPCLDQWDQIYAQWSDLTCKLFAAADLGHWPHRPWYWSEDVNGRQTLKLKRKSGATCRVTLAKTEDRDRGCRSPPIRAVVQVWDRGIKTLDQRMVVNWAEVEH